LSTLVRYSLHYVNLFNHKTTMVLEKGKHFRDLVPWPRPAALSYYAFAAAALFVMGKRGYVCSRSNGIEGLQRDRPAEVSSPRNWTRRSWPLSNLAGKTNIILMSTQGG
jgi:hypothetical protein